jgi:hypothetical protein
MLAVIFQRRDAKTGCADPRRPVLGEHGWIAPVFEEPHQQLAGLEQPGSLMIAQPGIALEGRVGKRLGQYTAVDREPEMLEEISKHARRDRPGDFFFCDVEDRIG